MTCFNCKWHISGPHLVVEGRYWCATCVYYKDRDEENPRGRKKR